VRVIVSGVISASAAIGCEGELRSKRRRTLGSRRWSMWEFC
jgi:hypothetical protein